jgi:hypothetical protein
MLRFTQFEQLMLRFVDDFLLITTDKEKATKFLKVMHKGIRSCKQFAVSDHHSSLSDRTPKLRLLRID